MRFIVLIILILKVSSAVVCTPVTIPTISHLKNVIEDYTDAEEDVADEYKKQLSKLQKGIRKLELSYSKYIGKLEVVEKETLLAEKNINEELEKLKLLESTRKITNEATK